MYLTKVLISDTIIIVLINSRSYQELKERYIPKHLYIPRSQISLYLEIKLSAAKAQKSIWQYICWLQKQYGDEDVEVKEVVVKKVKEVKSSSESW